LAGWSAQPSGKEPPAVSVYDGKKEVRRIELKEGQKLTDFALLPPKPPLQPPILALAYHELGQPTLALYNAASGERVRQLGGHSDRIYCLAFSADGRLLVSASEDQTVCIWTLVNLDQTVGRLGVLPGVGVKDDK